MGKLPQQVHSRCTAHRTALNPCKMSEWNDASRAGVHAARRQIRGRDPASACAGPQRVHRKAAGPSKPSPLASKAKAGSHEVSRSLHMPPWTDA